MVAGGGTNGSYQFGRGRSIVSDMRKRLLITALWFYAGWYGAAFVAGFTGMSEAIGPITGAVLAAIVVRPPHLSLRPRPAQTVQNPG